VHEQLRETCDFVLGPYGSDSTRAVVQAAGGAVVWNHGAAADDVQRLPGVVSVPSPASRFLVAVARALDPGMAVAVLASPGRFARFAREGLEAERLVRLVDDVADADAVLLCGPLDWELERFRSLRGSGCLLGGVSPGLSAFADLLGADPEGFLAPVQWHPGLGGPAGLDDYVAAQAYAAAVIAEQSLELGVAGVRGLRTRTFFGAFELDETGLQVGHKLSVIRWHGGRRELALAEAA
jgi:hypothetical protein